MTREYIVESQGWSTCGNYYHVVIFGKMGTRCGYVAIVDPDHPAYGKGYSELDIDCHGGLTYDSKGKLYPIPMEDVWWVGFDCAHLGDRHDWELAVSCFGTDNIIPKEHRISNREGTIKSNQYCKMQCENIERQLNEMISGGS